MTLHNATNKPRRQFDPRSSIASTARSSRRLGFRVTLNLRLYPSNPINGTLSITLLQSFL